MCLYSLKRHQVTHIDKAVLCESHLDVVISLIQAKVSSNQESASCRVAFVNVPAQLGHPGFVGTSHRFCHPNRPAVPIEAERSGCWSACINFRGLRGLAVSTVVTIAKARCLLGRHAVTPATVVSTQEA